MADQQGLVPAPRKGVPGITCSMCGIGLLPADMVADGGSACADVRWYCLDVQGCTERWTSHAARPADLCPGTAESDDPHQASSRPRRRRAGAGTRSRRRDHGH